jgi:AMP-binding enzyme
MEWGMLPAEHGESIASDLLGRLAEAAWKRPDAVALRYKSRGSWLVWTWRDVVRETDRFASFLRSEGIGVDSAIALAGEIRPSVLFSALAARAIGAGVVSVAPDATATQIEAVLDRHSIGLALMHGRRSLAAWLQVFEARPRRVAIVFDHFTPAGRAPEDAVIPISAVMATAPAHDWAEGLPPVGRPSRGRAALWAEASTAWREALDVILDVWLSTGDDLAVPELLTAAARDRAEIAPGRWIASAAAAAVAAADIASRIPSPRGVIGFVARLSAALRRLVLALTRRRLGLSRLHAIEVERGWKTQATRSEAEIVFGAVGLAVLAPTHELADDGAAQSAAAFHARFAVLGGA